MFAKIIGTGSYLPVYVRTNNDLEKMIGVNSDWIVSRTGVKERRIANLNETVATMGILAARKALDMADIHVQKVGMVIVATISPDYSFPSSACQIQRYLGINDSISFDLSAACSGFIYALSVADKYISSGIINYALVIGSDILSNSLDPNDRDTLVLFGDGAGAVLLGKSEVPGIISTHLHADGRYGNFLSLYLKKNKNFSNSYLRMKGNKLFKMSINKLSYILNKVFILNKIDKKKLDWLILHQANLRIITSVVDKLGLFMNKVIVTIDKHGNTSAASIPLALDEGVRDGRIKYNQLILLGAFGGGVTWGAVLFRF